MTPSNRPLDVTRRTLVKALEYDDLTIPVLPKIAQDIMVMSQDPDADIATLSELIHHDQSIASHVLHISNSASFGGFERVESLELAVARLGLKLLSEIAISVSIQKNVFNVPAFHSEIRDMWRHSLASAIFAKELAGYCQMNTDTLYLCALLHEIGKPVTLFTINNLPEELKDGLTREDVLLLVEEFHMSVGTIVTRQWELPEAIQYANLYYRDWVHAPMYRSETAVTYLADQLASRTLHPEQNDIAPVLEDSAFERLEIPVTKLERLLDFKESVLVKVNSMDF
ncbi:MAG: HDOD domain-containing protein [Puniceicoccaceae bacterium]